MHQRYYVEALADDQTRARRAEYSALEVVIAKLRAAREGASLTEALDAVEALWSVLISDVSNPHNALPTNLRSNIVSIGCWMFSRSAALRNSEDFDLDSMIDVNIAIRDGLRAKR